MLDIRNPEFKRNPYPFFAELRHREPVCRIEPHGHWAIANYEDVLAVLKNPGVFSSAGIGPEPEPGPRFLLQTRAMIGTDAPDHTRLRNLIKSAFTPLMVRSWETQIRESARHLLVSAREKGTFDFVRDFAVPLPLLTISQILGVDPARIEDFKRWSHTLLTWRNGVHLEGESLERHERRVTEDSNAMFAYFNDVIDSRKGSASTDIVSTLLRAQEGGSQLTSLELLSFIRLLLVAGSETTTNLLGNTLLALLSHPEEWQRVKQEPRLIPKLIEESLRFDSPALSLTRRTTMDTEVHGVPIAKGERVLPLLASANHDERKFPRANRFDTKRENTAHLSFGSGAHFCLGAPLARLQARVAFEEIFQVYAFLERSDEAELVYLDSFFFRGLTSLPVEAVQDRSQQRA